MTEDIPQKGDIVEVFSEGCTWVGYYMGEANHNGRNYLLVSPYSDHRPNHWLDANTKMKLVRSA